ncbi:hypothetical protein, partial [Bifidobacterium pseudolongum]
SSDTLAIKVISSNQLFFGFNRFQATTPFHTRSQTPTLTHNQKHDENSENSDGNGEKREIRLAASG